MRARLLFLYMTLTAFVLVILEVPLGITFARHEQRSLAAEVERDAFVMASSAEDVLEGSGSTDLAALVGIYRQRTQARVVIVDTKGFSVADSEPTSTGERDFSTRTEIRRALAGDVSSGIRHSTTLGYDLLYVAVPVASGGVIHGAVRITYPMSTAQRHIRRTWLTLGLVAMVVLLFAFVVGWRFASSVARPLRTLEVAAAAVAAGDLGARAPSEHGPPEVRSVSRTFNQMAERLDELVSSQQQFVADASHQLRTPLAALQLRLEEIEDKTHGSAREDAVAAGREAWRLERIVEGLLALARAEGTRPDLQVVDVASIAGARKETWTPLAEERSMRIVSSVPEGLRARIVHDGLEQIIDNLLANAIDVAPEGSAIRIEAEQDDGRIELRVSDSGPGLTPDERTHAFDRFWRGASEGDGGSGLGLAIVRQLARASGGDAVLEDAPGGGLTAVVRLPAA